MIHLDRVLLVNLRIVDDDAGLGQAIHDGLQKVVDVGLRQVQNFLRVLLPKALRPFQVELNSQSDRPLDLS
jgi:hypothetical protein